MKSKRQFAVSFWVHARCSYLGSTALALVSSQLLGMSAPDEPQTSSSPIAIAKHDAQVWVVNPDNDSVSVINVKHDANRKMAEISVGEEPRFLAYSGKGQKMFVSNSRGNTVTMIHAPSRKVLR